MAYNTPWSEQEEADTALGWQAFHEKSPQRTYQAWRVRRGEVERKRTSLTAERPKPKPVSEPTPEAATALSDAELLDAYLEWQSKVARTRSTSLEHRVSLDVDEPVAVAFASDWHIGSEGTDLARLKADCELIASHPRLYLALGGDVCDNFIFDKMASAARSMTASVEIQWRLFRHMVGIVQDSLLWVSSGNHDAWTHRAAALDPIMASLHDVPCVYTGEGGWVDLTVGTQTYTVYRKHKPTRFNSNFNRLHWHKQMLRGFLPREADVLVSEHLHEQAMEQIEYRGKQRVLIACGSYKVRDAWAESGGYYTGGYGVPTVVFYPDRKKMLAFWSIEDALEALDGPSTLSA